MRVVPTHGTLHGGTAKEPLACPPALYLELSDDEAKRLIAAGVAKEYVEGEVRSKDIVITLPNADATPEGVKVEQASVGADGAASGEAAPAAASEATANQGEGEAELANEAGEPPAETPEENAKLQDVADHIELLSEDDFVKTGPRAGKPKVAPLAEATGHDDLTAEEVDAAFALHEAAKGVSE